MAKSKVKVKLKKVTYEYHEGNDGKFYLHKLSKGNQQDHNVYMHRSSMYRYLSKLRKQLAATHVIVLEKRYK